jgi:DNA-binding response OmpR family regulator
LIVPSKTVLLIEDEPHIVLGLRDAFEFEGFRVVAARKGKEGLALARTERPDVVVLDLMLPDLNGFEVCGELRRMSSVPILMLTARSQESDKIRGLDAGADDYVTKPFSVNELIARVRALLRRVSRSDEGGARVTLGECVVDLATHTLSRGGQEEPLSFHEVELLRMLVERVGQPVSREDILQRVWGVEGHPANRTVDNCIVKLRKKIEEQPDAPRHILTVYGFGYKLVVGRG